MRAPLKQIVKRLRADAISESKKALTWIQTNL